METRLISSPTPPPSHPAESHAPNYLASLPRLGSILPIATNIVYERPCCLKCILGPRAAQPMTIRPVLDCPEPIAHRARNPFCRLVQIAVGITAIRIP